MISDKNKVEKLDRFIDGLKHNVKIDAHKASCDTFEECALIALMVDSAIWRADREQHSGFKTTSQYNKPTPMEIGNVNAGVYMYISPGGKEKKR